MGRRVLHPWRHLGNSRSAPVGTPERVPEARRDRNPRSPSTVSDQAFVTLAANDVYCQGALVLGQSLREHRATRRLVVLLTPQVSTPLR